MILRSWLVVKWQVLFGIWKGAIDARKKVGLGPAGTYDGIDWHDLSEK